jgi:hypothetical protein
MWISFDYRSDKQASQPGHDIPDRPAAGSQTCPHLPAASAGTSIIFASPTAAPDHHLVHRLLRVGRPPPFVHNSQSQWMGGQSSCSSPVLCAIILSAEARTPTGNADRRLWKSRLPIRAVKFLHMKSAAVLQDARQSSVHDIRRRAAGAFPLRQRAAIPISIHRLNARLLANPGIILCITGMGISL